MNNFVLVGKARIVFRTIELAALYEAKQKHIEALVDGDKSIDISETGVCVIGVSPEVTEATREAYERIKQVIEKEK